MQKHFKWDFSCIWKKQKCGNSSLFWSLKTLTFFLMDKPSHIFLLMCHCYSVLHMKPTGYRYWFPHTGACFLTPSSVAVIHFRITAGCHDVLTKLQSWSDLPRRNSCPWVTATWSQVSVSQGTEQRGTGAPWLQSTFPSRSVHNSKPNLSSGFWKMQWRERPGAVELKFWKGCSFIDIKRQREFSLQDEHDQMKTLL